jgi:hypothetical protein
MAPAEKEQVLDLLMRAPKKLTCVALDIAGSLAIGTWPTFWSRSFPPDGHEIRAAEMFERLPVPGEGEDQMIIMGSTGEVRLTARELRLWDAAYDLPMSRLVHGEDDDDRARSLGVKWVATVQPEEITRSPGSRGIVFEP